MTSLSSTGCFVVNRLFSVNVLRLNKNYFYFVNSYDEKKIVNPYGKTVITNENLELIYEKKILKFQVHTFSAQFSYKVADARVSSFT